MNQRHLTLAIFIDALGWRIAQESGFLADELPHRGPMATTFGYSSTCDPTILTGALPREHGHFAFFTYDPVRSPFRSLSWPSWLPASLAERGRVRRQISRLVQRQLGYTGYFQLYNAPFSLLSQMDYTEKRDLYQPGGIINGQTTLFDDLRHQQVPFHLSNWRLGETDNLAAAARDIATGAPRFAYVFLAELDAILHAHGTRSPIVLSKLRWYENQVRQLLALARRHYERVTLAVFSDHGMADITRECDLMRVISALPLRFGTDYFAIYDSTVARFYFLKPEAERIITDALAGHPDGSWLSDSTLHEWGCDFPDRRYGHKFFLLRPGVLLNPSFMGRFPLAGMHGYEPGHEDSVAYFGTNDPLLTRPQSLMDIRRSLSTSIALNTRPGRAA